MERKFSQHSGHYLGGKYKIERKYELTNESMEFEGHTLHRIKALVDFSGFTKGTLGGWIESEDNLSHEDGCWIHGESKVFGDARIRKSAQTRDNSVICEDAVISGNAAVYSNSRVSGDAFICDNANIYGASIVSGHTIIGNNSRIINSIVSCEFLDYRGMSICLYDAKILDSSDYISFTGFGSINRTTYMFRGQDGSINVRCGCFTGTLKEFEHEIKHTIEWKLFTKGDKRRFSKEYLECVRLAKIHFGINLLTSEGRRLYGYNN